MQRTWNAMKANAKKENIKPPNEHTLNTMNMHNLRCEKKIYAETAAPTITKTT